MFLRQQFRSFTTRPMQDAGVFSRVNKFKMNQVTERPLGLEYMSPITRIIDTDQVTKPTGDGKIRTWRALVVSGNGIGAAGIGIGHADSVQDAIEEAKRASLDVNKWVTVDMTPDGRLWHDVIGKHNGIRYLLQRKGPKLFGLKCGRTVFGICECFGIKHITSQRLTKRKSPYSDVYAIFHGLTSQQNPVAANIMRGAKIDPKLMKFPISDPSTPVRDYLNTN